MLVKFIKSKNLEELETMLNDFLCSLPEEPKGIKYYLDSNTAVVEYEPNAKGLCCDCKYWDDGGSTDSLVGLCQKCGGRKRFNARSCNNFEDLRR